MGTLKHWLEGNEWDSEIAQAQVDGKGLKMDTMLSSYREVGLLRIISPDYSVEKMLC